MLGMCYKGCYTTLSLYNYNNNRFVWLNVKTQVEAMTECTLEAMEHCEVLSKLQAIIILHGSVVSSYGDPWPMHFLLKTL